MCLCWCLADICDALACCQMPLTVLARRPVELGVLNDAFVGVDQTSAMLLHAVRCL